MKKLLGTVLAVALSFTPGLVSAEVFKNLTIGGQVDLQTISGRNIWDFNTQIQDHVGVAVQRTLVNADWDLLDDVHATVTLRKNDRLWGTAGTGGSQGARADQSITGTAGATNVLDNIYVERAFIKIDKVFGHVDMSFGKQYFGEPGDLVFYLGKTDAYGLLSMAGDMFIANYSNDMLDFTGMAGKFTTTATMVNTLARNDQDIHGAEVWWKLPVKANTYVWRQVTHRRFGSTAGSDTTGGAHPNDYLWVYGLKLRGEAGGSWFHADASFNTGEERQVAGPQQKYVGKAFLVKAGYNADLPNIGGLTPWANFGWGSGESNSNDENTDGHQPEQDGYMSINSDYRPGIINRKFDGTASLINLGRATDPAAAGTGFGTNGLSNRVVWGGGVNFTPAMEDRLTLGLSFWDFRFQRVTVGNNNMATAQGNRHIGSEAGVSATWQHSENVTLAAGWAHFAPGGYVRELSSRNGLGGVSPIRMVYSDVSIKF